MATLEESGLRDGYADLGEVRLHYVEAGEGPLIVLLHGFPEFWLSWRFQIPALASSGFRVVAPDMRGYNLSSRPPGVGAYRLDRLAADVRDLIHERGARSAFVAGHDWGGAVAWSTAMRHPEEVGRLAILNVPHPRQLLAALRGPRQLARSWYMFFFLVPRLPERMVRSGHWRALRHGFEHDARPGAFTPDEVARYVEAWSQPGAATGMLNYYRAALGYSHRAAPGYSHRAAPGHSLRAADERMRTVTAPTLVIWGERDRYFGAELAEPDRGDVPNLERVVRLETASHWVQHDEPERVGQLLVEFFATITPARSPV